MDLIIHYPIKKILKPLFNKILMPLFGMGVLVFIHEFGHFVVAKKNGVRVEKFSFGFGRRLWGRKIGDTEYLISTIPLGGYIKMSGDEPGKERKGTPEEFLSKSCGQRALIVAFGPILNYLLAFLIFSLLFIVGVPTPTTKVGKVLDDYPAKEAGIKEDDIIIAVDGKEVKLWQDMASIIQQKTQGEVALDVKRGDITLNIKALPKIVEIEDIFGKKYNVARIGIEFSEETVDIRYGWKESFLEGGKKIFTLTSFTYQAIWFIIIGRLSFKESMGGPIAMFRLTGNAAEMGLIPFLNLIGIFSMALAIFNFLPLPVLDGGHLLFLLLEKLRKRPVSARVQEVAAQIGMLALVTLLLFVSYFDLVRSGWWR